MIHSQPKVKILIVTRYNIYSGGQKYSNEFGNMISKVFKELETHFNNNKINNGSNF
jgi:hypothetical protein